MPADFRPWKQIVPALKDYRARHSLLEDMTSLLALCQAPIRASVSV